MSYMLYTSINIVIQLAIESHMNKTTVSFKRSYHFGDLQIGRYAVTSGWLAKLLLLPADKFH